jgi:hypothetical protein
MAASCGFSVITPTSGGGGALASEAGLPHPVSAIKPIRPKHRAIPDAITITSTKTAHDAAQSRAVDVAVRNFWKLSGFLSGNLVVSLREVKRSTVVARQAFVKRLI